MGSSALPHFWGLVHVGCPLPVTMDKRNHYALVLLLLTSCFGIHGCCRTIESNPALPTQVRGWAESDKEYGIKSLGEFVLRKGESINNGRIAIELQDTIRAKTCRGTESTRPGAIVRFYRVADGQVMLQIEMGPGNTRLINFNPDLPNKYDLDTISISEINTVDQWVWFEVWK